MKKNEKQEVEKWKLASRKMANQNNFSCQNSKLKIRNVANNYEKIIYSRGIHSAGLATPQISNLFTEN